MRYAVFSDIHANVWALRAVLEDAEKQGAGQLVNLGDILYGPLAPRETYDLLRAHDVITIQGNQDRIIYDATDESRAVLPTLDYVCRDLGKAPINWLKNLPKTEAFDGMFLCHGAPGSDMTYLLEDVSSGHAILRSDAQITVTLSDVLSGLTLCGHPHIPRHIRLTDGREIANPGSAGLPAYSDDLPFPHVMETGSPHARYLILDIQDGRYELSFRTVSYDWDTAARRASHMGRDDWASALRTGRIR
ncbi:metallophosphoesterase family protein [Kordiimonas marina]|uniref:metallophosphoesterase family protein n=1 Tax=Kordiimonas marina TaxID=2872312 RepID=UPI001FF651F5|nr:metallophosphoesterase family protein [Kordiimonas marina]MCJ9428997.1 metallophosphatase family protein [Kordiimonas marina]